MEERVQILEKNESLNINLKCLAMLNRLFEFDQERKKRAEMKKESALIMDQFFDFLKQIQQKFLASSKLGRAISYALNAEEYVRNYLLDPELEISNNRGERMIKDFVIGRKNFLFSNTKRGAHASSILYSVCESAKLNNLNVYEYLVYVLNTIAKQGLYEETIKSLLPYSSELPEYLRIKKSN